MNVKAKVVEKTSKAGKQYFVVEIYLTDNVVKTVFLDQAEVELVKLTSASK